MHNLLDTTQIVIDRLWKPTLVTVVVLAVLVASIMGFGFIGTVALLAYVGLILAITFRGNEIYFWAHKHVTHVSDKVRALVNPVIEDIVAEIKFVAAARATLTSAKATREDALNEMNNARNAVKSSAKTASNALEAQLIAAGNGDNVTGLLLDYLDARKDADNAISTARAAKVTFENADKALEDAKKDFRNARETFRNSNEAASTS